MLLDSLMAEEASQDTNYKLSMLKFVIYKYNETME
jgi:hypothetical protein